MPCRVHSPRGTQFLCDVPNASGLRPVIMGYAPIPLATAKAARNPPRKRGPSAGLVGGYWFVIDHEDASLNKTRIVFVANDLIPYSANVPLEGSTGRIKAFPVLLAYDP